MSLAFEDTGFPMSMSLLEDAAYLRVDGNGEEHLMFLHLLLHSDGSYLVHAEERNLDAFPGSSPQLWPNAPGALKSSQEYPDLDYLAKRQLWSKTQERVPALSSRRAMAHAKPAEFALRNSLTLRDRLFGALVRHDHLRPTLYSFEYTQACLRALDLSPFEPAELGLACLVADLSSTLAEGPQQLLMDLGEMPDAKVLQLMSPEMEQRVTAALSLEKRSNTQVLTLTPEHLLAGLRRCLNEKAVPA